MLKSFPALVALVLVASLGVPRTAEAGKLMLITHGDQIRELTPTPGAPDLVKVDGLKIGYVNSYGGLFWIDFWTWGGQYCVYAAENQRECQVIPPGVAATMLGVPEDQLPTPFFYRFPLGLVILAGLGLAFGVAAAFGTYSEWSERKLARRLITQPLYEKVMTLPPGERAAYLAAEGVPEKEAEANLLALTNTFEPKKPDETPPELPPTPPTPPAAA